MATKKATAGSDFTVEEKLKALHNLQTIDSEIDRIRTIRGELPLEVQDLDDDIVGLETRLQNLT
ncbi:MAG: putative nucleic acid-binding Zn-ribbon protein, partial [Bacteroidia bacterium]